MTNSTRCALLAKQACTTLSHVVQKITPPSANNFLKLFFALFAMLALGVGNAWGAEIEMSTFTVTAADMDSYISYSTAQGGGTSDPNVNDNQIRLYQGNPGGNITVSAKEGVTITEVTIGSAMKTAIKWEIDGTKDANNTSLSANGKATKSGISTKSITCHCYGSDKNNRLYVNYLKVVYTVESSETPGEGGGEDPTPDDGDDEEGVTYELVTSTSKLEAGAKYIVGNSASTSSIFMSTALNTNNRKVTSAITITDNKVTITEDVLILELGGETGAWTFKTTNYTGTQGFLTSAASGDNNHCKVVATAEGCSYFTVAFDNQEATITSTGRNERNILRYNSSNSLFACYSSGQSPVYLYKLTTSSGGDEGGTEEPALSSIEISGDLTDKTYEEGEELDFAGLTVTAKYDDNSEEDVTNDVEWSYEPLTAGQPSVTVTATYEELEVSKTINDLIVTEHVVTPGEYDITLNNVFFGTAASANITGPVTGKQNDITITINGTGSSKPRTDATYTRFYTSSTMAISVPSGYVIKSIAITKNESDYANPSVTIGAFDNSTKTWTGTANSVTMSFSAKSFINSIKVTYAIDVKYALNITTPSNGTLVVKDGSAVLADGAQVYEGTKLVVTPTPNAGYVFESLTVGGEAVELTEGSYTFNMPAADVTIAATFKENEKPAATLTLSKNGDEEPFPGSWKQDDVVTLPTTVDTDCVKEFVGWSADANCATEPEYAPGASYTLASTSQTLYAVYATVGESHEISIAGGDWSNGIEDENWTTQGTGTYSGNGVKFDNANDYVMSPDISSKAHTRLLLKFKSGYNGSEGSVLTFYTYNKDQALLTDEDVIISPKTVVPTETYTKQNTIYEVSISANEVIGYIAIKMTSRTSNLGMSYCEIFGVSTSYSNYSTTCVSETDLTDEQFAWSASSATALKGATENAFPTLTNSITVPVTYSSSNTSVATIEADGKITLLAPGITTISAKFAGGEVSGTTYAAKTVDYTLTVKQLVSCADIYNLADDATFVLKDFVVTYVNGKYTYIKDDTGYGLIYIDSYGLNAGDQVASGKFEGKKTTYRTLVEIIPITAYDNLNATSGEAPVPEIMATNPTDGNINKYVKFEKVSFDADKFNSSKSINGTIEGQSTAIKFYNQFAIEKTFDISKKYSVVGIVSIFDNNLQVYFISAEEVAEPTLNVEITNADFGKIAINGKAERTLTLNGSLLTNTVSLAIEGEYFTLASESVTPEDGKIDEAEIKIYYQPTVEGTHNATLKITSDDVAEQTITLTGQAAQQYTVHFFVNGEEKTDLAAKVLSDNTLEELPTATSCDPINYPTFAGWASAEIVGTTDEKPTMLDQSTPITSDCNYYAVFAKGTKSSGSSESATMQYTGTTSTNMSDSNNASTVGLDEALFTITSDKGGQNNHVGLNQAGDIRLYADKTDGNGNILTIAMAEGYTITQISLVIKQPATFVVKANGQSITGADNVYNIDHTSCSIQNTTTGETTQLRLNSITITYTTSTTTYEYITSCAAVEPTCEITYDFAGGEGECTNDIVEEGAEYTLCATAPTKTGHTFLNWKDQNGDTYEAGATITVSSNLTLTAQWQKESYKVTWTSLGEEVASANVEYNSQPTKPATAPSYTCGIGTKEFVGWTTQEIDGVGVPANLYTDEFPVVTEAITYHAVFASKIEGGGSMSKAVSLTNGETVYLATESGIGVTGAVADGKDATVSTTQGDWMPFIVVTNGLQYQFKTGDNYITAAAKSFKITETPSDFAFENGYIVYNVLSGSDAGDYVLLVNNNDATNTYYRFYKASNMSNSKYETFYVYKNPTHTDFVTTCEVEPDIEIDYTTLSGVFSVAADKKVQFSTGNLQYEVGTNTWLFASKQYEVIGGAPYDPANPTNTNFGMNVPGYIGKLDLFAWSSDGKYGVNPSNTDADYGTEATDFVDWGTLAGEGWFTLTKEEMNYILNRTKNGKKLWALATIDKLPGLILLPDNWNTNITLTYGYIPTQFEYNENVFTAAEWKILEVAGAVFLPAAGSRTGGYGNKDNAGFKESYDANGDYFHVDNVGIYGYYWLNTQDPRTNFKHCASYLILPGWDEGPTVDEEGVDDLSTHPQVWSREKRRGNSVRLVKTVEEEPQVTVSGRWELVTDASTLAVGDQVVIAAKDYNYALSTTQKDNNRGQAAIKKNNDNTISFDENVQILTLEAGSVENTFALNTGNGYLYAASSSKNYLRTETNLSDNSSWTIAINEGHATIEAQGTNENNLLQYNQSSSLFACYGSASQQAICLYRKKNVKVESNQTTTNDIPNYSDVTVGSTGQLKVEKPLIVENLYIQTTMGATTSAQSAQISNATNTNLLINGDVFIDITLGKNGDGKNGDPNHWHAFTVPFPVDAMNGVYDINDKKLTNEVNYAIMDYHGDLRANGQYGWKKYRGILVPGTFYLMTVDSARTTYRFKKVKGAKLVAENTKSLSAYTGGGKKEDQGWNGVGNPTLMHGKVAYNVLVLNPEEYTYEAYKAEDEVVFTVGTPFFIQAGADDDEVTIASEVSGSLAPARRAAAAVENIKVMLGNSDYTDRLYVSASEDATNEYEIGKDLAKMIMTKTPSVPQIFAEAYNTSLCMIDAPMVNNEAVVALNLYAPANGEYTLSIEAQDNEKVYLLHEGTFVWDLSMSEYPITLKKGDNTGYSILVHRADAPTSVETIEGTNNQTEKLIHNGNLYILHNGKVFDAVGTMLK